MGGQPIRVARTAKDGKTSNKIKADLGVTDDELYVLAAEVKTIGDTPLVRHAVRILDPETGGVIEDHVMTDEAGVVRAMVPENKTYRIEIVDEEREIPPPAPLAANDVHGILICHFVDGDGNAVANEGVEARCEDDQFSLVTDEDGRIEAPAHLSAYDLKIRGETFTAHALLWSDRGDGEEEPLYRFVLPAEDQPDGEEHKVRLTSYTDLAGDALDEEEEIA